MKVREEFLKETAVTGSTSSDEAGHLSGFVFRPVEYHFSINLNGRENNGRKL